MDNWTVSKNPYGGVYWRLVSDGIPVGSMYIKGNEWVGVSQGILLAHGVRAAVKYALVKHAGTILEKNRQDKEDRRRLKGIRDAQEAWSRRKSS